MINTNLKKRGGGVEYTAPVCEFVELGISTSICEGSNGERTFGINDWEEDNTGLEF